ncbi:MAG: hypothetical protein KDD89_12415 [Anaerolineales bacterium]|nr:hypothetical protein [Anaerolineales bacterium]
MPEYDPLHMIVAPAVANDSGLRTNLPDIDRLFDHLEATTQRRLVLYFHGGLNNEEAGLTVAAQMRETFRAVDAHALSFVWETGLLESLEHELKKVTQNYLFRALYDAVNEGLDAYINSYVGVLGDVRLETATAVELEAIPLDEEALQTQFLTTATTNLSLHDSLEDDLQAPDKTNLNPAFVAQVSTPAPTPGTLGNDGQEGLSLTHLLDPIGLAKALSQIGWRVLQRRAKGQYHGHHATVVEEIVRAVYLVGGTMKLLWDNMKERAAPCGKWMRQPHLNPHATFWQNYRRISRRTQRQPLTSSGTARGLSSLPIC